MSHADGGGEARTPSMSKTLYFVLKEPDQAADEIERLREALESILEDPPATLDEPDEDHEVIAKMRAIALRALSAPRLLPDVQ